MIYIYIMHSGPNVVVAALDSIEKDCAPFHHGGCRHSLQYDRRHDWRFGVRDGR